MAGTEHSADDDLGIRTALLDYFEGWFDGDPARMESALHPDLAKRGVRAETAGREVDSMTADQMVGWTRDGEGVRERPRDLEIRIEVARLHHPDRYGPGPQLRLYRVRPPRADRGRWRVLNTIYMRTPGPS